MDIVERLRQGWIKPLHTPTEFAEAADEIESLRQQLAECKRERDEVKQVEFPRKVEAVAKGWRKKLATMTQQRDELATKVTAWEEKFHAWMATPEAAQRLDGYRSLAQQLNAALMERDELVAALEAVQHVANESTGIVGWHRNGDIATWDELLPEVDAALAKVGADKTGEV